MTILLLPNSELVACAWLAQVPGWNAGMVGTTLPRIGPAGPLPDWIVAGFVTVTVVGGTPGSHVPQAHPVLSVNTDGDTEEGGDAASGVPEPDGEDQPQGGRRPRRGKAGPRPAGLPGGEAGDPETQEGTPTQEEGLS
jgi:hypothetical protein